MIELFTKFIRFLLLLVVISFALIIVAPLTFMFNIIDDRTARAIRYLDEE